MRYKNKTRATRQLFRFVFGLAILGGACSNWASAQSATESTIYAPAENFNVGIPSGLVQGQDGHLFGSINGSTYSMTTGGAVTLFSAEPYSSALVQGPNGNFYG